MDPRFKHPFTCVVAGPTGCGKTYFVKQLIANIHTHFKPVPERIVWCYGEWQSFYTELPQVEFIEGLTFDIKGDRPTLLIIDDLMQETDERVTQLFTKGSHHRDTSVVYLVQNLFGKNKHHRTISLNAQYIVVFKNPRDGAQIMHLAKQIYPGHVKYVQEAFLDATREPYGYLLVDLKQDTPEHLRLRTDVLKPHQTVYLQK